MIKYNLPQKVQLTIVTILLTVVLTNAIRLTYEGYYGFYYENSEYNECNLSKITKKISYSKIFRYFGYQTGFNTGYGFFAPNVASDFLFIFKIYDESNVLISAQNNIVFNTKESAIRFQTINTMYLDKLKKETHKDYNEKYNKYLDIVLKQLSNHVKRNYPIDYRIETQLYLYDYPSIKNFQEGKKERLFLIKTYKQ